eukprot:358582-Chlamydomonas_euryale.AAC.5
MKKACISAVPEGQAKCEAPPRPLHAAPPACSPTACGRSEPESELQGADPRRVRLWVASRLVTCTGKLQHGLSQAGYDTACYGQGRTHHGKCGCGSGWYTISRRNALSGSWPFTGCLTIAIAFKTALSTKQCSHTHSTATYNRHYAKDRFRQMGAAHGKPS